MSELGRALTAPVVALRTGSNAPHRALRLLRLATVLASLLLTAVVVTQLRAVGHTRSAPVQGIPRALALRAHGFASLPAGARAAVSATLGAEDRSYRAVRAGARIDVVNRAQGLRASFTRAGAAITLGSASVDFSLRALGPVGRLRAVPAVTPRAASNEITFERPNVIERWTNGPLGLEQSFALPRAPGGQGTIALELAVSGSMRSSEANGTITFAAADGSITYGGLRATDASGRVLASSLELAGGLVLLRVDARGARYPLRIDPFVQQAKVTANHEEAGTGILGFSSASSADGNTVLVGAPLDNSNVGAAWVFTRSGGVWTQQGTKLTGSGESGAGVFGWGVALSETGNTAVISAQEDSSGVGAVYVFTRTGSTWSQQGAKLTGTGATGNAHVGDSVAVSADGNTLIAGGNTDNSSAGAAWVFTRSGETWTQQGAKLTATGETGSGNLGFKAALSADGNTALIGAPGDNTLTGAAFVFTRSGGTWTQQGGKLTGTEENGHGEAGFGLALSSDGNTAVIGAPFDENLAHQHAGAVWVFTRSEGAWTQQGGKLTGAEESGGGEFGYSLALGAEGNTALIGGPNDNANVGAAWVFTRAEGSWSQQGSKLTATGEVGTGFFGESVAISSDGNTAMIGAAGDAGRAGSEYAFTRSGGVWSQQGPKLTARGELVFGELGWAVAISADGGTAIVAAPNEAGRAGGVFVYTRSGETWTQQQQLRGNEDTGPAGFGFDVALSADGNTAVVGAPFDNGENGSISVFKRFGGVWSQQGPRLTGSGAVGKSWLGFSVALSADGNTAIAGGLLDNAKVGAAWVFTRSGETWTQQGGKLTGEGEVGAGEFGNTVALSSDGNTALVTGVSDNGGIGAAWIFTRSEGTWTQQGGKLTGSGELGKAELGFWGAISGDGNTVLLGGAGDHERSGAAWVFVRSGETWTQQGSKLLGAGEIGHGEFGYTTSLSSDGNVALITGQADNGNTGAAWTFVRSGETWKRQGAKITPQGASGVPHYGWSGAISGDGTVALVGGPGDSNGIGALWALGEAPEVASVSPTEGSTLGGTEVTITGAEFVGTTAVKFGATNAAKFTVNSSTSITAVSPPGAAGETHITVTNGAGTSEVTGESAYLYVSPPAVTKLSVKTGPATGGVSVTITGHSFTNVSAVSFGSVPAASYTVVSPTSITAVSPAQAAGTVDVRVTGQFGTSAVVSADKYKVAPVVSAVNPASGPAAGGTSVTITGAGFALGATASSIKFGTVKAKVVSCISTTECKATAPAHEKGTVDVVVTVAKVASAKSTSDRYTYE